MGNITSEQISKSLTFNKNNNIITIYMKLQLEEENSIFFYKSTYKNKPNNVISPSKISISVNDEIIIIVDNYQSYLIGNELASQLNIALLSIIYEIDCKKAKCLGFSKKLLLGENNNNINTVNKLSTFKGLKPEDLINKLKNLNT
jgi:hypothetical protein